jgi:REP element-mobilizing transposase RayT
MKEASATLPPMPRKARIDMPGGLHHLIFRGIERKKIFQDDVDRKNLLGRLDKALNSSETSCYAWALMPNLFTFWSERVKSPWRRSCGDF